MMRTIASLFSLLLLLAPSVASADDSFYETRLASGKLAFTEKRMPDAVTDLRIAAFGFLDRPPLLSETLVWLTLAESASRRPDRIRWALTRFIEVETRFHPYKQLALDAASRGTFEKILVTTLAADTIASIPTLSELVAPASRRASTTPSREAVAPGVRSTPPPEEGIPVIPQAPPAAPKASTTQPAPSSRPPATAPQTSATRVPAPPPQVEPQAADAQGAETIEKGKDLLEQNKNDEALAILRDLVARSPSRAARKYLLHAATRTHNWQTAVRQVPFVAPFKAGEEVTMFYAAVALYHMGKVSDARLLLERALPGINPSHYVESYKQKIFGH